MDLEWMAWTPVTATFFIVIFLLIIGMTIWEIVLPNVERKGLLPIVTSRGDRFFIGLLGSGYICIFWLAICNLSLWFALPVCIIWTAGIMRFG